MVPAAPPLRTAILARVSREDQKNYGYSLDEQIRLAKEYCAAPDRGYLVTDDLIFTGDESGKKPVPQRPILQALIDAILADRVDVVVVLHTSRLTRDQDMQGHLRYVFKEHGARIEYVLQEVPDGPIGRAMLGLYGYKDEQEWEDTRWRTQNGIAAKVASGKPIGAGRPRTGSVSNRQNSTAITNRSKAP